MAEGRRLKVKIFLALIPTLVEVTGEKLVGGEELFAPLPSPILSRVNSLEERNVDAFNEYIAT